VFEHRVFDLPVCFAVVSMAERLCQELDFVREADNPRRTTTFVPAEPYLPHRVYIPKVYPEYFTRLVMTAEWIDSVRLSGR
jgi:aarF domain-containing kinase